MDSLAPSDALSDSGSSTSSSALYSPPSPRPALPASLAAQVLRRVVASQLQQAGFDSAEDEAMDELEGAVGSFFGSLLEYAHQLAELGRRHVPNLQDVVQGCEDLGVGGAGELRGEVHRAEALDFSITYKRPRVPSPPPITLPSSPTPSEADDPLLASPPPSPPAASDSDSDDGAFEEVLPVGADGLPLESAVKAQLERRAGREAKRAKKRAEKEERQKERERRRRERRKVRERNPYEAEWLPSLPPKHSWKQTPVYPTSAAPPSIPPPLSQTQQAPSALALQHLSTLRARLNDSQLVAESLRNLIRRTGARTLVAPASSAAGTGAEGKDGKDKDGKDGKDPTPTATAQVDAQDADVVDYESEWYGAKEAFAPSGGGGRRRIRVVKVGAGGEEDEFPYGGAGDEEGKGKGEWMEGSRVGGAAKRRRWLV
ncbi:hypothetical protein JCM10207_002616 [Rhodosporidiobolus poonsookiae]